MTVRRAKFLLFRQGSCEGESGMRICARTTAGIWQHADEEHQEQDQKIRMQTNLCMLVDHCDCIVFLCLLCA